MKTGKTFTRPEYTKQLTDDEKKDFKAAFKVDFGKPLKSEDTETKRSKLADLNLEIESNGKHSIQITFELGEFKLSDVTKNFIDSMFYESHCGYDLLYYENRLELARYIYYEIMDEGVKNNILEYIFMGADYANILLSYVAGIENDTVKEIEKGTGNKTKLCRLGFEELCESDSRVKELHENLKEKKEQIRENDTADEDSLIKDIENEYRLICRSVIDQGKKQDNKISSEENDPARITAHYIHKDNGYILFFTDELNSETTRNKVTKIVVTDENEYLLSIGIDTAVLLDDDFDMGETEGSVVIGKVSRNSIYVKAIFPVELYEYFYPYIKKYKKLSKKADVFHRFIRKLGLEEKKHIISRIEDHKNGAHFSECIRKKDELIVAFDLFNDIYFADDNLRKIASNIINDMQTGLSSKEIHKLRFIMNTSFADSQITVDGKRFNINDFKTSMNKILIGQESAVEESALKLAYASKTGAVPRILFKGRADDYANALAVVTDRQVIRIDLNCLTDECALVGSPSHYENATPGKIYKCLEYAGTTNVIFLFSNVDSIKTGSTKHEKIISYLAPVFSGDSATFEDQFLNFSLPLTGAIIIADYTDTENLDMSIFGNLKQISLANLSEEMQGRMIREIIIPEICEKINFKGNIHFTDQAMKKLFIYTEGDNVRSAVQTVIEHIFAYIANKDVEITESMVEKALMSDSLEVIYKINKNLYNYEQIREIELLLAEYRKIFGNSDEVKIYKTKTKEKLETLIYAVNFSLNSDVKEKKPIDEKSFVELLNKTVYKQTECKTILAQSFALGSPVRVLLQTHTAGVGKSSVATAFAKASGQPFFEVNCSAITEDGLRLQIAKGFRYCKTSKMILVLNEIDKTAAGSCNTLLELTDDSNVFTLFGVHIDTSALSVIATANNAANLPAALKSRFLQPEMDCAFSFREKTVALENYILPKLAEKTAKNVTITSEASIELAASSIRQSGLRLLEKNTAKVLNYVILKRSEESIEITDVDVYNALGKKKYGRATIKEAFVTGAVNALCVNNEAGKVTPILAVVDPATRGFLDVYGGVSQNLKEELIKIHNRLKACYKEILTGKSITIDFGNLGTKKDGASCGLSICALILSTASGKGLKNTDAFTGCVDLLTNVTSIGALSAKRDAALLYGIKRLFIPADNLFMFSEQDIDFYSKHGMSIIPVKNVKEMTDIIFAG